MAIPTTKREKLMIEREQLYAAIENARTAYADLASGRITSYSLGTRSISRNAPDLKSLTDFISNAENRIAEIEAILNGRPVRNTSRYVFVDPSMIGRRW